MAGNVKPGNPWPSEGLGRALDIAGDDKPYEISPTIQATALLLDTTGREYNWARRAAWLAAGGLSSVPAGGQYAEIALQPRIASASQTRLAICRRIWVAALDGSTHTTAGVATLEYTQEITPPFTATLGPGPLDLRQLRPAIGISGPAHIQSTWATRWAANRLAGPGNADGSAPFPVLGLASGGSTLDVCIAMQSATYQGIKLIYRTESPDLGFAFRFEWEELDVSVQNLQSRS